MISRKLIKFKVLFLIVITASILLLNKAALTQGRLQKNLESSRVIQTAINQGSLSWGIRVATPPFGYVDISRAANLNDQNNPLLGGFCVDLIKNFEEFLQNELSISISIKLKPISYDQRYHYTEYVNPYSDNREYTLAGECGSDTKISPNNAFDRIGNKKNPNIKFSEPYLKNIHQLLLIDQAKKSLLPDNNQPSKNEKLKIGYLEGTNTPYSISTRYPDKVETKSFESREDAVDSLLGNNNNKIKVDAIASDEPLLHYLFDEILPKKVSNSNVSSSYEILSEPIISSGDYALILPGDDSTWKSIVNKFLDKNKSEIQKLLKNYNVQQDSNGYYISPRPLPFYLLLKILIVVLVLVFVIFFYIKFLHLKRIFSRVLSHFRDKNLDNFDNGYALLIGVGKCQDNSLSLPETIKDVTELQNILVNPKLCAYPQSPHHICVLCNEKATRSGILEGLEWLKSNTQRNATAIVYYSGHGWFNQSTGYYLVPHETDKSNIENTALSAEDFTRALREIESERLLVIIDSCHAGGMATAKAPRGFEATTPKDIIDALKEAEGRVVLTSCRDNQKSWINTKKQMSIFTYHLIQAFRGAACKRGRKVVTIADIMNHLTEKVPKSALEQHQAIQEPYYNLVGENFAIALIRGGKGL